jgi:hypothetical protein
VSRSTGRADAVVVRALADRSLMDLPMSSVLALQSSAGNRAVVSLMDRTGASRAVQPTPVVQRVPCPKCGIDGGGHRPSCRFGQKKARATQEKRRENSSWDNVLAYDKAFVKKWSITETIVKEFCKQYEKVYKIRGHGSGDESDEKNAHTQLDLDIFHAWYRRTYPDGHD